MYVQKQIFNERELLLEAASGCLHSFAYIYTSPLSVFNGKARFCPMHLFTKLRRKTPPSSPMNHDLHLAERNSACEFELKRETSVRANKCRRSPVAVMMGAEVKIVTLKASPLRCIPRNHFCARHRAEAINESFPLNASPCPMFACEDMSSCRNARNKGGCT
jgi:hypothetical protein